MTKSIYPTPPSHHVKFLTPFGDLKQKTTQYNTKCITIDWCSCSESVVGCCMGILKFERKLNCIELIFVRESLVSDDFSKRPTNDQ